MFLDLRAALTAALGRTLDLDHRVELEDAATRVAAMAAEQGIAECEGLLREVSTQFRRHAVINPSLLRTDGVQAHFYLLQGRAGLLDQVIADSTKVRNGLSQYVLYGDWDSLIVLHGAEQEADVLSSRLVAGAYEEPVRFKADHVLVAYRHPVRAVASQGFDPDVVNGLVDDFDGPQLAAPRDMLLSTGAILGPTWRYSRRSPYPVTAWIGINLRGRRAISGDQVCQAFVDSEEISGSLVHLFQIDHGRPFHFLAKVSCVALSELDDVTNAIGLLSIEGVRFDGETLVVANGIDTLPTVREPDLESVEISPDISPILRTAELTFSNLTSDERAAFNRLDDQRQLVALRAAAGLRSAAQGGKRSKDSAERVRAALALFEREVITQEDPKLTGAVLEIAATVEGASRRLLSKIAYAAFGENKGRQQERLHLPTRRIRGLSLGKVLQAFDVVLRDPELESYHVFLPDDLMANLRSFVDIRNRWAHDAAGGSGVSHVDDAFIAIRDGIVVLDEIEDQLTRLVEWGGEEIEDRQVDLRASDRPDKRVFVSHSSADSEISERIAYGLRAFGYSCWYAEWEIQGGESIVNKINDALSESDVLVVVLSRASVTSDWVKTEMNAALMRQLAGADVTVIPALVEDCDVPQILLAVKYVDMRTDFEAGFIDLHRAIAARRKANPGR